MPQEFQPNLIKSPENKKYVHDLLHLSEEEFEILKKKISENKGLVRVVIHPYYVKNREWDDSSEPIYRTERKTAGQRIDIVETTFKRMIQAKSSTPIFLFEEHERVHTTTSRITGVLKEKSNEIYMVPTHEGSPQPYTNTPSAHEWAALIQIMSDLGVKKIIIGGIYLELNAPYYKSADTVLAGCVGGAANHFKQHFDVQISSLSHPKSRKDLFQSDFLAPQNEK